MKSALKVVMVGNFGPDAQHSMGGFASALLAGMPDHETRVEMIAPRPIVSRNVKHHAVGVGKWLAYVDKYVLFPKQLRERARRADVLHICDQGNGIYASQAKGICPVLLTCHDLFAIRAARGEGGMWQVSKTGRAYQKLIWRGITQATNIACDTDATRNDLLRLLTIPGCDSAVPTVSRVLIGMCRPYARLGAAESEELLRGSGVPDSEPFLLHVGGNQAYKNRIGVLSIYGSLRARLSPCPPLVLAGRPMTEAMRVLVSEQGLGGSVIELTGASDTQINALYSRAVGLLFPSLMEGFGLPIIEAQACGCPVFTTNAAPMTEVGGSAAIYLDPSDPEGAARIVADALSKPDRMAQCQRDGYRNVAERFPAGRMIEDYRKLYREMSGV